ncbi:MAG: hypothetical protein IPL79_09285 [Myxococcales bacterium]|nr:hypothetical protein [Myxococcales bacterium]
MFRIVTLLVGAALGVLASSDNSSSRLTAAYDAGDLAAVQAQGSMLTAAALRPAIDADPPGLPAIWAAPSAIDRHALLSALGRAAGHWDHHVATTAALSARSIARELAAAELETAEVLDAELDEWIAMYGVLATNPQRRNDVRVLAAEVALGLAASSESQRNAATSSGIIESFRTSGDAELVRIAGDLAVLLTPATDVR